MQMVDCVAMLCIESCFYLTCACRFTATSDAEVMRNALDGLQQAGAALQELCMRFCEALADSVIQQLLAKPMSLLQNTNYNLSEAEYAAMEVLQPLSPIDPTGDDGPHAAAHQRPLPPRSESGRCNVLMWTLPHCLGARAYMSLNFHVCCMRSLGSPQGLRELSSVQVEPGWPAPLCSGLQYYWDLLMPGLATEAHQEVSRALLARLLIRIEGTLKIRKFTALGGLLLDRYAGSVLLARLSVCKPLFCLCMRHCGVR